MGKVYPAVLITLIVLFGAVCSETCRDTFEQHLGTQSSYRFVGNRNYTRIEYPNCTPTKIWMLVRHGTRYPSEEIIEEMQTRLPQIKELVLKSSDAQLTNSDIQLLKKWKVKKFQKKNEMFLTPQGDEEMVVIAERMQARLPDILPPVYSNTSYKFRYTNTERTKKSAEYFAIGLFGKKTAKDVWYPEPSDKDPILRFYKACAKWHTDVKKNPQTLSELEKFKSSDLVLNSIRRIEKKMGLNENTLNYNDVQLMYTTCAFETAWNRKPRSSAWCIPFDLNSIKLFEYADDLKHYWVDGYGYNITYKQACASFVNMINFHERTEVMPKAILYFTHSGTLLKVQSHLGLFKDDKPLTHDNIDPERKWRVSKIDAFATNLAFLSYKCGTETKLLMLHQESVIRFPCCPDEDLCPMSKVKAYYDESISHCNFQEMCAA